MSEESERIAQAESGETDRSALELLARDTSSRVRLAVARNLGTPLSSLRLLTEDVDSEVRRGAFGTLGERVRRQGEAAGDVVRQLGKGAFGVVNLVRRPGQELVARKTFEFLGHAERTPLARQRFVRGAQIMRDLLGEEERIVRIIEIGGESTEQPWFDMEFVPGCDLAHLIDYPSDASDALGIDLGIDGQLPMLDRAKILIETCEALCAAHAQDVLHRDIKPRNVLVHRVDDELHVKLCDFDTAYVSILQDLTLSSSDRHFGSPCSPPWLKPLDRDSDLSTAVKDGRMRAVDHFGVCATAFFVFTGEYPYGDAVVARHLETLQRRLAGTDHSRHFAAVATTIRQGLSAMTPEETSVTVNQLRTILKRFVEDGTRPSQINAVFCFASPTDIDFAPLRTDREYKSIREVLRSADPTRIQIEDMIPAATAFDLQSALTRNEDVHVFHFSGHGQQGLILDDPSGNTTAVSSTTLGGLLSAFMPPKGSLECVVLNACDTDSMAEFLASEIGIQHVVGVRGEIEDEHAIAFSRGFYDALANGHGFQMAVTLGISSARLDGYSPDVRLHESKRSWSSRAERDPLLEILRSRDEAAARRTEAFVSLLMDLGENECSGANLDDCSLQNLDAGAISLVDASANRVDLSRTSLRRALLTRTVLNDARLSRAILSSANLEYAKFENANLSEADMTNADASHASFRGADLTQATLIKTILSSADLEGAKLVDANLSRAECNGASFRNADLCRAVISRTLCVDADFTGANLRHADINRAELRGADLRGALNLELAKILNISHDQETKWPEGFLPPPSVDAR